METNPIAQTQQNSSIKDAKGAWKFFLVLAPIAFILSFLGGIVISMIFGIFRETHSGFFLNYFINSTSGSPTGGKLLFSLGAVGNVIFLLLIGLCVYAIYLYLKLREIPIDIESKRMKNKMITVFLSPIWIPLLALIISSF